MQGMTPKALELLRQQENAAKKWQKKKRQRERLKKKLTDRDRQK